MTHETAESKTGQQSYSRFFTFNRRLYRNLPDTAGDTCRHRRHNAMTHNALQKAVFYPAKGHLLQCKKPCFAMQNMASW